MCPIPGALTAGAKAEPASGGVSGDPAGSCLCHYSSPGPHALCIALLCNQQCEAQQGQAREALCQAVCFQGLLDKEQRDGSEFHPQSRSLLSPSMEVDVGAHESSPADGGFVSLAASPDQGPLFPERPDFPTGTKCNLFAGHESWRGATQSRLGAARQGLCDIRQIPPSPQLGPTAGSRREALNKSRKMGHVYSFTDQPGPGCPWAWSPWRQEACGAPTWLPCDHGSSMATAYSHTASWRHPCPDQFWSPLGKGMEVTPEVEGVCTGHRAKASPGQAQWR